MRQLLKIQRTVKTLFVSWDTESETADVTKQLIINFKVRDPFVIIYAIYG
jgi:acid phosphatase class B